MFFRLILLISLILFSGLSLFVQEQYPFSHFPMYASPSPNRFFYWLATAEGDALPVKKITNKSTAEFGKIIKTLEKKIKNPDIDGQILMERVGKSVLASLRKSDPKNLLPDKLSIMRTDITYQDGQILERVTCYYSE